MKIVAAWLAVVVMGAAVMGDPLAVGVAGHAFDHLGGIGDQAEAAAASGETIIYSTGFGSAGYAGLPDEKGMEEMRRKTESYLKHAKEQGIQLAIGYVCATSIVRLEMFDRNWPAELRGSLKTPPSEWLQEDRNGMALASWYGGDYRPACMNNPDWRTYEKYVVKQQLDAGHDGIFFDNPTVHPQGCYCQYCMKKFAAFLKNRGEKIADESVEGMRNLAVSRPKDFMRFRGTIAGDFMAEMRNYARSIKPGALITCNNSLNAPEAFYSQCRTYGYDIDEMSKVEDLVVVEDMSSQPRVVGNGRVVEYGPVYEMLAAIAHGKPVVAVTIAEGDYHTPGDLARLAMAEAAAHGASYLAWPTWPVEEREKMEGMLRPEAELLRENAGLLNGVKRREDVAVYLPFEKWADGGDCYALPVARDLSAGNIQFGVVRDLQKVTAPVLMVESMESLSEAEREAAIRLKEKGVRVVEAAGGKWMEEVKGEGRSVEVDGPATMRAVVREQGGKTIVHLLNLNIERVSSFEDRVSPAEDLKVRVKVPGEVKSVKALTADGDGTGGELAFTSRKEQEGVVVEIPVKRVSISTMLVIE